MKLTGFGDWVWERGKASAKEDYKYLVYRKPPYMFIFDCYYSNSYFYHCFYNISELKTTHDLDWKASSSHLVTISVLDF